MASPAPRRIAVLLLAALAGCAGPGDVTRAIVKTADGGARPAIVGLLYPQVEPGSADGRGEWPKGRKFMSSEIAAVVYVQVRGQPGGPAAPPWKDFSVEAEGKARISLLGASIHREYSLNGGIPAGRANELGRAANAPACLLVSIVKFGPSATQLELKSLAGLIKPAATTDPAKAWINCGVVAVAFRTPGGQVLWEAGYLASLPADANTQEQAAARCVEELFKTYPWR